MKKFARILASSLLKTTLFSAAVTAAIVGIISTPNTIKKSLNDSGVYDSLVSDVFTEIEKSAQESGQAGEEELNINQPQIKSAAQSALDPATLQNSTEQVLDGVFRWLNGEVETPDFRVDLTAAKQNFISAAGQQAEAHVASLPVCTAQELRAMGTDTDAFSMTCRPANVSAATARQQFEAELANNEDFLKDPVVTPETLSGDTGKPLFADMQGVPDAFQTTKTVSLLLLVASILLGAAVFFLSETRRKGVKSLAITLLGTGIFLFVTGWLTTVVLRSLLSPDGAIGKSINNSLQDSILAILRELAGAYGGTILKYSLVYGILGGLALLVLKFAWKQPQAAVPATRPMK